MAVLVVARGAQIRCIDLQHEAGFNDRKKAWKRLPLTAPTAAPMSSGHQCPMWTPLKSQSATASERMFASQERTRNVIGIAA